MEEWLIMSNTITHDFEYLMLSEPFAPIYIVHPRCNGYPIEIDFDALFPVIIMKPQTWWMRIDSKTKMWVKIWYGECPECGQVHQAWIYGYV